MKPRLSESGRLSSELVESGSSDAEDPAQGCSKERAAFASCPNKTNIDCEMEQLRAENLVNHVMHLQAPVAPPASPLRKSPVSVPDKFSGQTDMFLAFMGQCQLFMSLRPEDFPNDRAKVGFIISLLSGPAAKWATPLLTQDSPLLNDYQGFQQQLRVMYENPIKSQTVARRLKDIRQGKCPLQEYIAEFRLLCMDSTWNESAHMDAFQEVLADEIQDELVHAERALTLVALVVQCLRIEARLQRCKIKCSVMEPPSHSRSQPPVQPAPLVSYNTTTRTEEPMELGALRPQLTAQERS
uniref:DUF4939 domain-containing protein n=1 Tax=Pseudonaja textilis TaxID=8673 RepID=A0A670Z9L7_PSETE